MAEGIKKISENVIIPKRALVVTDPLVPDNDAISVGCLWTDSTLKGLKLKVSRNSFSLLDASQTLLDGSILTNLLKDGCVTNLKLSVNSVSEEKLCDASVTTLKIKDKAVTEQKISENAITESKIKNGAVSSLKILDNAIIESKIANEAVTTSKIADKTITAIKLADSSIINRVIANNAIEERNYSDSSISNSKLQDGCVFGSKIKNKSITSLHLNVNAVVTETIANGAVTSLKIADLSIVNNHLAENCVDSKNIINNAITTSKINNLSVTSEKIANKTITKEKLASDVIDLIGDPVTYDIDNNVELRKNLNVNGDINATGIITANKVYNSTFMDLAEAYEPDENTVYIPGDIVQVNEEGKIVKASSSSQFPIVGVVSDEYAACYGATKEELEAKTKIAVGLIGKVHVNVIGPVKLGDKIAVAIDGAGASAKINNLSDDNVIGKALESNDKMGIKKVLCLIYPR